MPFVIFPILFLRNYTLEIRRADRSIGPLQLAQPLSTTAFVLPSLRHTCGPLQACRRRFNNTKFKMSTATLST